MWWNFVKYSTLTCATLFFGSIFVFFKALSLKTKFRVLNKILNMVLKTKNIKIEQIAMLICCNEGNLDMVKTVISGTELTDKDIGYINIEMQALFLQTILIFPQFNFFMQTPLKITLTKKYNHIAKYLIEQFPTIQHIAVKECILTNNLEVLQLIPHEMILESLIQHYAQLSSQTILFNNVDVATIQWLYEHFEGFFAKCNIFNELSNFEIIKWYFDHINVVIEDFHDMLFHLAQVCPESMIWFYEKFPDSDIRKHEDELFKSICAFYTIVYNNPSIYKKQSEILVKTKSNIQFLVSLYPNVYTASFNDKNELTFTNVANALPKTDTPKIVENVEECTICREVQSNVVTPCGHLFCYECINKWFNKSKICPYCIQEMHEVAPIM